MCYDLRKLIEAEIREANASRKDQCMICGICTEEEIPKTREFIKSFLDCNNSYDLTFHIHTPHYVSLCINWGVLVNCHRCGKYIGRFGLCDNCQKWLDKECARGIDDDPLPPPVRRNKYGIYVYEGE
jgi:hypothetical protein